MEMKNENNKEKEELNVKNENNNDAKTVENTNLEDMYTDTMHISIVECSAATGKKCGKSV